MDDVKLELQALQAVYGDDCRILESWPPRVELLLRPRTADELSQQFVEIVLGIKASCKYPGEPPAWELVAIKGLDDSRQRSLLAVLSGESEKLLDEPMLVTISEAAVEFLTTNNYPDGECCFCLMPLMGRAEQPFMKLMTCFHCFHSHCFSRWWNWMSSEEQPFCCPVCRAQIHFESVAHMQQELQKSRKVRDEEEETIDLSAELLESEAERQAEFSMFFEAQKARGGIIEPRGALSLSAEQASSEQDERSEEATPGDNSEQDQMHPEERSEQPQASQQDGAQSKETSEQATGFVELAGDPGSTRARSTKRNRQRTRAKRRENFA